VCGISVGCTPTFIEATQTALRPEHLGQLKEELRAALERVEAEEQRVAEQMKPQSLEEVQQLEEKLTEALAELKKRRKELEKRSQGSGG
jgi:hypothetical protein